MTRSLLPPSDDIGRRAIEGMLESLADEGAELPIHVFVDDGDDAWQLHAARVPVEDRRRSVIAARTEATLVTAVRFEIGGASWLPASTPSVRSACDAATTNAARDGAPLATDGVLWSVIAEAGSLAVVEWWPRSFWIRQLGPSLMCSRLTAIAERLGCVPAIVPGPVLVIADVDRSSLEAVVADRESDSPARPTVRCLDPMSIRAGARLAAILEEGGGAPQAPSRTMPVLEMPSGRQVGRWALSHTETTDESGWLATPSEGCHDGERWQLVEGGDDTVPIVETIAIDLGNDQGATVIRVPGFVGAELRPGGPAGLLVERLAHHVDRRGRPIWVPSADAVAIRFLLGLPGPIWVDGPGVPSD